LSPTVSGCLSPWAAGKHGGIINKHTNFHGNACPSPTGLARQGYYAYLRNALYDGEKSEGCGKGQGERELTGEGVEEERGRDGKRADGDQMTCSPLKNCWPGAPGRRTGRSKDKCSKSVLENLTRCPDPSTPAVPTAFRTYLRRGRGFPSLSRWDLQVPSF
jgi:hypothetical protein